MTLFGLFDLDAKVHIMDIGAADLGEVPIYKPLLDQGLAHLTAFDGDARQFDKLKAAYGPHDVTVHQHFVFDGQAHDLHICGANTGMTSIFEPNPKALEFFNGFPDFGRVERVETVQTTRLDDIEGIAAPDFLKMDVQGAELGVLQNGPKTLGHCLAMQLEVSFFNLYRGQPSFGEIDMHLRARGFVPHRFVEVKRWSIAPTIFDGNFRLPGNQLLEGDIIYVRDPLKLNDLSTTQIKTLATLAHWAFQSVDYCVFLIQDLIRRGAVPERSDLAYLTAQKT